jgi:hypothetical protein
MTPKQPVVKRPRKRPYRTPTLKTYGNLKTLTQGKGGNRSDLMTPKTRMGFLG